MDCLYYYDECGHCGFKIIIEEMTDDNLYNNVFYCDSCAELVNDDNDNP